MAGIVFFKTAKLQEVTDFYLNRVGASLWLQQKDINILKHGNMLFGFHASQSADTALLCLFMDTPATVDDIYPELADIALFEPKANPEYNIYHFFCKDPEGRIVEFQSFNHPISHWQDAATCLTTRRSIRSFYNQAVPPQALTELFELCRWAPTSRNSQSVYYVVLSNKVDIARLATVRDGAYRPLQTAPHAVAVVVDPQKTMRVQEDGNLAAQQLMLAAHYHGLGTCYIADMNRHQVKQLFKVPPQHFIATVTPLGYPSEYHQQPQRLSVDELVRFV